MGWVNIRAMARLRSLTCSIVALTLLALAPPVAAQTVDEAAQDRATELVEEAVEAFEARDYDAAAELFRAAWLIDDDPRIAFNLARALHRAERWEEALHFYTVVLAESDDDRLVDRATEAIAEIEAIAGSEIAVVRPDDAPMVGTLVVTLATPADGARVRINQGPLEDLPFREELPPGPYQVRVEADGYEPFEASVDVDQAQTRFVDARLHAESRPPTVRRVGYGLLGAGAAAIAGGAVAYGITGAQYSDAEAAIASGDRVAYDDAVSRGRSSRSASTAMYATGGVLAGVGVLLVILDPPWADRPDEPRRDEPDMDGPLGVERDRRPTARVSVGAGRIGVSF